MAIFKLKSNQKSKVHSPSKLQTLLVTIASLTVSFRIAAWQVLNVSKTLSFTNQYREELIKKVTCLVSLNLVLSLIAFSLTTLAVNLDGFDYPVGPPDANGYFTGSSKTPVTYGPHF